MTLDYKMYNWTNVNQESNKKLMDDLMWDLGLLTPEGVLMVMPDKLSDSLIAVADRLEFYHGWNEQQKKFAHLKPYKPIAHVVYKDGTVIPVDIGEEGHSHVEDIFGHLQDDIRDEKEFTKLQNQTVIKLRKVEKVINPKNGEEFIIDHYPNSPKVVFLIDNTRSVQIIEYEQDFDSSEEVVEYIKKAVSKGETTITNTAQDGKQYPTDISKLWRVTTSDFEQEWIINKENKAPDQPTLEEMRLRQLRDEIGRLTESISQSIDEDDMTEELEMEFDLLDEVINEVFSRVEGEIA